MLPGTVEMHAGAGMRGNPPIEGQEKSAHENTKERKGTVTDPYSVEKDSPDVELRPVVVEQETDMELGRPEVRPELGKVHRT
jgi:hypothetical protein